MLLHEERLANCDVKLVKLVRAYSKDRNLIVVCGYRSLEDQEAAYKSKHSKARPGESKHNKKPSEAVDLAPTKDGSIDWEDIDSFKKMAKEIIILAHELNIPIAWGGDFEQFKGDYGHFELAKEKA